MAIIASAALVIFVLAPGGLYLYRERLCRGREALSGESVVCAALAAAVLTSFVALVLLELSLFRIGLLLAALGLASAVIFFLILKSRRPTDKPAHKGRASTKKQPTEPAPRKLNWPLLVVLAVGLFLRLPPSLSVHGGQDQGVYLAISQHFIRTGRIYVDDPLLKQAFIGNDAEAQALRALFIPYLNGRKGMAPTEAERFLWEVKGPGKPRTLLEDRFEGTRLPGFYIADKESGRIVPQFFHLHPIWLALFSLVGGGFTASVYMLPFFSLLAIATIYYLARRAFGSDWAGLLAAGFLAVDILQVWTNRFPVAETLAQSFLFGGLLFYYRWRERDDPRELWLAAGCFGAYVFARGAGLLLLPMFIAAFWLAEAKRREYLFYNLVLGLNLLAVTHGMYFGFPYIREQFLFKGKLQFDLAWWHIFLLGLVCIGLVNVVKLALDRGLSTAVWNALERRRNAILVAAGVVALALYALLVVKWNAAIFQGGAEKLELPSPFSQLLQFTRYATFPGIVLAVIGVSFYVRRQRAERPGLLLLLFFFAAVAVLVSAPPNHYQFYYGRYYMAELLPPVLIFAAFGLIALWERRTMWQRGAGAALGAAMALLLVMPYFTNPAYRLQENRGAYAALAEILPGLPAESVSFVGYGYDKHSFAFNNHYATALTFLGDRYVLPFSDPTDTRQAMRRLIGQGKEVMLLVTLPGPFWRRRWTGNWSWSR